MTPGCILYIKILISVGRYESKSGKAPTQLVKRCFADSECRSCNIGSTSSSSLRGRYQVGVKPPLCNSAMCCILLYLISYLEMLTF